MLETRPTPKPKEKATKKKELPDIDDYTNKTMSMLEMVNVRLAMLAPHAKSIPMYLHKSLRVHFKATRTSMDKIEKGFEDERTRKVV